MKTYWDLKGDAGSDVLGQVAEQRERVRLALAGVRHQVAVMSGKGGVGKSLLTANLAACLAARRYQVGVLDADLNGPSAAGMLGARRQALRLAEGLMEPAVGVGGVRVMSMDFLLEEDRTPLAWRHEGGLAADTFVWRGTLEASALREFLADVRWGELDYLLVDLPPGTDRFPTVAGLLERLDGAIVVTIPTPAAEFVVRKSLAFLKQSGAPVLGLVENMAGYLCPHCGQVGELHPGAASGETLARSEGVPFLGSVLYDPRLSHGTDRGRPAVFQEAGSAAAAALAAIADRLVTALEEEVPGPPAMGGAGVAASRGAATAGGAG